MLSVFLVDPLAGYVLRRQVHGKVGITMAMIKCRECGAQVSSKARACPTCGAAPKPKSNPYVVGCGGGFLIFLLVVVGFGVGIEDRPQPAGTEPPTNKWDAVCADPAAYVQSVLAPLPRDRVEVTKCEENALTIRVYPKRLRRHAVDWLRPVVRKLVDDGIVSSSDFPRIHLRVVALREGASGQMRPTAVSGAHFDYAKDEIVAKTQNELGF